MLELAPMGVVLEMPVPVATVELSASALRGQVPWKGRRVFAHRQLTLDDPYGFPVPCLSMGGSSELCVHV